MNGELAVENKNKYWLIVSLIFCVAGMSIQSAKAELDSRYLRNGETYLLIGSGSKKGVYRIYNPTYPDDPRVKDGNPVITKEKLGENRTLTIAVDLWRNLYTFTNQGSLGMVPRDYIWRQVLDDTVPKAKKNNGSVLSKNATADFGAWSAPHTDSRPGDKRTNVYRTVTGDDSSRTILGSIKALKPGTNGSVKENPPSWYKLPSCPQFVEADLDLVEYSNKTWYKIPNKSWYSCWKPNKRSDSYLSSGNAYMCFYDEESADTSIYNQFIWPNRSTNDLYSEYTSSVDGGQVAYTESIQMTRYVCAGCLDSCTQKNAPGSYESATMTCDIVMQPGLLDGSSTTASRTYALTRTVNSASYTLTLNGNNYHGCIKGYANNKDSQWVGISLKDAGSDFVYVLGNEGLKHLYKKANPSGNTRNMQFTAVTVSNQWNQKGGIIYAYDKNGNYIHRFTCDDVKNPTDSSVTLTDLNNWEAIDVREMMTKMGGDSLNACLDDIKADGFGNLYMGITFPSPNNNFDAKKAVRPNESKWVPAHYHAGDRSDETGTQIEVVYPVDYGKYVFKKEFNSSKIDELGHKAVATDYYSFIANVPAKSDSYENDNDIKCVNELKNAARDKYYSILKKYGARVNDIGLDSVPWGKDNTPVSRCLFLGRICNCADYHRVMGSVENPGNCKLAVINVPTPPRVHSIFGLNSYLDICGPYSEIPLAENGTTNQGYGLLTPQKTENSNVTIINPLDPCFFMVENYPLQSGAQNPNDAVDIDGDTRFGGFVSTIENVKDNIWYEWKVWCVHNGYRPVCKERSFSGPSTPNEGGKPFVSFCGDVGKYIVACRVKYNWYNYDNLDFGSTISHKENVKRYGTYAKPSAFGFPDIENVDSGMEFARVKLNAIKNLPEFAFMKDPRDERNQPISVDYSQILSGDNADYWFFEPIVVDGNTPPPSDNAIITTIERCDVDPIANPNAWASAPNNLTQELAQYNGIFGVESQKSYYWRVDSEFENILKSDISEKNGTNKNDAENYNYIADHTLYPHYKQVDGVDVANPLYLDYVTASGKRAVFENKIGDLVWQDNFVDVFAYIYRTLPGNETVQKISVKDVSTVSIDGNLFVKTKSDLPVTDPGSATIEIELRRQYYVTVKLVDENGQELSTQELPRTCVVIGRGQVNVIDRKSPSIKYTETKPNNLYAYTGDTASDINDRPDTGRPTNPININFTIEDNNPWEGGSSPGISLQQHVLNYIYNYGYDKAKEYCQLTDALWSKWNSIDESRKRYFSTLGSTNGRDSAATNKKPFNYLPLFSKEASDVRFYFETVARVQSGGSYYVEKGRADSLYKPTAYPFTSESSVYACHSRIPDRTSSITKGDTVVNETKTETASEGTLTSYIAKTVYTMPVSALRFGISDNNTALDRIPDYYANNSAGYRPYEFYVSAIDCSGNYWGNIGTASIMNGSGRTEPKSNIAKKINIRLHVADNIPPIVYGSLKDEKTSRLSYFPYKTPNGDSSQKYGEENLTLVTSYTNAHGYGSNLSQTNSILRVKEWTPQGNDGYVVNNSSEYKAINPVGQFSGENIGRLITSTTEGDYPTFYRQVQAGLSPHKVEDNVECTLGVTVSDNCGSLSVATMTINALDVDSKPVSYTVSSKSESKTESGHNFIPVQNSKTSIIVFRGDSDEFPMAVPVLIRAEDDAKCHDTCLDKTTDTSSEPEWGPLVSNGAKKNVRIFRTTIPVVGSGLDIRTLDKSIKKNR